MAWWAWAGLWVLLVVAALGVFLVLGLGLWHKLSALFTELGAASERLGAVSDAMAALSDGLAASETARRQEAEPAVFADPARLRAERDRERRRRGRRRTKPAPRGLRTMDAGATSSGFGAGGRSGTP